MSEDISLLILAQSVWESVTGSAFFNALSWFLGIYGLVILADVVLLVFLRDIRTDIKKTLYGTKRPLVSHSKFQKRWDGISVRIGSGNPSQYKAAVLEADTLAEEMVSEIGYDGANMAERLASVREGQILSLEGLKSSHALRNRIIRDPDLILSVEEVSEALENYRKFFQELELL